MASGGGAAYNPSEARCAGGRMTRHVEEERRHRTTRGHAAGFAAATRMGFLVHELRNALACVFVAQAMIKKAPGDEAASALLERNLRHMRLMLDRADAEV